MKTPFRRPVPLLLSVLTAVLVTACERAENVPAVATATDTMLLHDLAQANRNTAAADIDTTIPVIVRSRPTDGEVQEMIGGAPGSASQILTPSGTSPRPPRRANDAPAPTNIPPGDIVPAYSDPCDSPAADDQRTCLNRAIARSDVNLNRVYQEVIAQARISGGSELEARFRDQQRAWVGTRDEECRRQTRNQEGTLWARVRARCLADYSARRTGELQTSLNSLRGR